MKTAFIGSLCLVFLLSCGGKNNGKKVLIMSKGKATVNKEAKTIAVEGGSSHEEQTVDFSDDGAVNLQLTAGGNKSTIDLPTGGYYVLNAKTDTIIGTYQNYGAPAGEAKKFSQDDVKHSIDSLQQLLGGNTTAGKTFYILPGKAVKITDNLGATMVGPFNSLTTLEQSNDAKPEVYKFYTSKDVRETMEKLRKMTIAPPSPNQ